MSLRIVDLKSTFSDAPLPLYDFSEFGLGNVSGVCNAPVQRQVECTPSYEFFLGKNSAHTHSLSLTHSPWSRWAFASG